MKLKRLMHLAARPFEDRQTNGREQGMTIIEILIVIALIGTLMTIIMSNILDRSDDAKVDLARVSMAQIENGLRLYKLHNNRYPSTEEGLNALVTAPSGAKNWRGPYSETEKLKDPWDVPFTYESSGTRVFKMTSAGPDQQMGTADDITYPAEKGDKPAE